MTGEPAGQTNRSIRRAPRRERGEVSLDQTSLRLGHLLETHSLDDYSDCLRKGLGLTVPFARRGRRLTLLRSEPRGHYASKYLRKGLG